MTDNKMYDLLIQGDPRAVKAMEIFERSSSIYKRSLVAMGRSRPSKKLITLASTASYSDQDELWNNLDGKKDE